MKCPRSTVHGRTNRIGYRSYRLHGYRLQATGSYYRFGTGTNGTIHHPTSRGFSVFLSESCSSSSDPQNSPHASKPRWEIRIYRIWPEAKYICIWLYLNLKRALGCRPRMPQHRLSHLGIEEYWQEDPSTPPRLPVCPRSRGLSATAVR
eukprot:scaffold257651_cov25-Tisochrysis_lutea.AAC.1